jgi:hypothetical protein
LSHGKLFLIASVIVLALSMPARSQTAEGTTVPSAQSNLTLYGTASPVVAGASGSTLNGSGSLNSTLDAAGMATGSATGLVNSGPAAGGAAGTVAGQLATQARGSGTAGAAASSTGTGTAGGCVASASATLGVMPSQTAGDCTP